MLTQDQFHLVTVKGREYYVHRYQGHLNKIDQAVVLLTYPKEAFGVCTALKVFLCSDLRLSDEEVLEHYSHRWKIEVTLLMAFLPNMPLGMNSRTTIRIVNEMASR